MRCCCNDGEPSSPLTPPSRAVHTGWPRRVAGLIQWAIPVTALALVPQCPMCVAAYVVLFTGVGLSLSVAVAMRWALIVLSVAAIGCLLFRAACRLLGTVRVTRGPPVNSGNP